MSSKDGTYSGEVDGCEEVSCRRREPSDAAPVWKHTAADRGFAAANRVGAAGRRN
jgi:hypothetical protein